MKTILVTGGTNGIGKGIAMDFLKKGDRVIVVGSSFTKGETFYNEAKQLGAEDRAIFLPADLSLVKENQRIMEEIKSRFHSLDIIVLCAQSQKYSATYSETKEGFEFTFGLYYLSRYILSFGLKGCLEKAENPVILNVCAPGMKGKVNWKDVQHQNGYNSIKAILHGSMLNDLLGVAFAENYKESKIKYILYNPSAVQTTGAMEAYEQPVMKLMIKLLYKIVGKPVKEAIKPIIHLLENPPAPSLSAFMGQKEVSLKMVTFDKNNAQRLFDLTKGLVANFQGNNPQI